MTVASSPAGVPGQPLTADGETRAKVIFGLLLAMGLGGFLFLCVAASTCGQCYVDPCVYPKGLRMMYRVNKSLCFAGVTTGMFFCFLAGWGALLTLRRRASVMGFGHFFGATCVTFLVAVQAAGIWGAEATLLEKIRTNDVHVLANMNKDDPYEVDYVHVKLNRDLHRACKFLFTVAILVSCAVTLLAPLYFVSRDVYDDDASLHEIAADSLAAMTRSSTSNARSLFPGGARGPGGLSASGSSSGRRSSVGGVQISRYEPIADQASDDERQYLGRAQIPMRSIRAAVAGAASRYAPHGGQRGSGARTVGNDDDNGETGILVDDH